MNGVCSGAGPPDLYSWKDVTEEFKTSCEELELGELLHDDMFGLFEAMSAIEMMDPKMDSGMSSNIPPLTFQEAALTNHLPLDNLRPEDLIGIIDESLSSLVAWLEGHSLVQTVFTNLYTHQPEQILDPTLKTFIYTLLRLVNTIKGIISRASVYEEEDHQPLIYGFRLYNGIVNLPQLLKDAEEESSKKARASKGKAENVGAMYTCIASRLKFLRLFYLGLTSLEKGEVTEGYRLISGSRDQLTSILSTVSLGTCPAAGQNMLGFDPGANQRLLPPTFPRFTKTRDRSTAVKYYQDLTNNVLLVCGVNSIQGFHSLLNFFQEFSSRSPCLLSRSLLQILYSPLGLNQSYPSSPNPSSPRNHPVLQDILQESCKDFLAPAALLSPPPRTPGQPASPLHTLQVNQCIQTFFHQCSRPFGLLLQSCGHNRARQREKLQCILDEFFTVQEEADKIDGMLNTLSLQAEGGTGEAHALYLSTWLIYHVLRLMIRYVVSGFELELYASHEYSYVYFYLHDLLYPWLINCLHRADTTISEHIAAQENKKKEKGKKKTKVGGKKNVRSRPYSLEIAGYQANSLVCGGMFKLLVAARKEGKILSPSPDFDNEAVRYDHRFAAFGGLLTPPLAPYSQYKDVLGLTEEINAKDLYLIASRDFAQARQVLESVQQACDGDTDTKNLITVCKTNLIVSSVLAKDSINRTLTFDFSLHPSFPIIKLS